MAKLYFESEPYNKTDITLALESGVDGILVAREYVESVACLARCEVFALEDCHFVTLQCKNDEEQALAAIKQGTVTIIRRGWEVIPIENLLAQTENVLVEVGSVEEAELASGILERGVSGIVIHKEALPDIKLLATRCKIRQKKEDLTSATITRIVPAGLGHRVCVDTLSLLTRGQGMLVGNSSAFTFLVHAETEHNEYVASRPFRINAGGVHAYARLPGDKTCYLCELTSGKEILVVNYTGETSIATVGRIKTEVRPMLLIEAQVTADDGVRTGTVFLQNAETIRLTDPSGNPVSVVTLAPGDTILCRTDVAGRHFGMRIREDIREV